MLGDLMMLRVACRVVEDGAQTMSDDKPRTRHGAVSTSIATLSNTPPTAGAMRTLPRLQPPLSHAHVLHASVPLPAITISTASASRSEASSDGQRIAPLTTNKTPTNTTTGAFTTHAADLMLGLKCLRSQGDLSTLKPRPHKRARVQGQGPPPAHEATTTTMLATIKTETTTVRLPSPPGVFMSSPLAALLGKHAAQKPVLHSTSVEMSVSAAYVGDAASAASASACETDKSDCPRDVGPVALVSFLGKRSRDDRATTTGSSVLATSPTSVWENAHSDSCSSADGAGTRDHSPVKTPPISAYNTHGVRPQVSTLRVPTLHQWRAPTLSHGVAPRMACATATATHSPSLLSSLPSLPVVTLSRSASVLRPTTSATTTTQPTLVRKSSSQWRLEMPAQDREKTRERLYRGLHNQCRGDVESLLNLLCAMDEELLHLHTTSKDHYVLQTMALRDRIQALRTGGHTQPSPRERASQ